MCELLNAYGLIVCVEAKIEAWVLRIAIGRFESVHR